MEVNVVNVPSPSCGGGTCALGSPRAMHEELGEQGELLHPQQRVGTLTKFTCRLNSLKGRQLAGERRWRRRTPHLHHFHKATRRAGGVSGRRRAADFGKVQRMVSPLLLLKGDCDPEDDESYSPCQEAPGDPPLASGDDLGLLRTVRGVVNGDLLAHPV